MDEIINYSLKYLVFSENNSLGKDQFASSKCKIHAGYFPQLAMFKWCMAFLIEIITGLACLAYFLNSSLANTSLMNRKYFLTLWALLGMFYGEAQESNKLETNLAGVYQEKTLFIQNPYNRQTKEFCIQEVQINGQKLEANYNLSALKLDFQGFDSYTPVKIKILHKDTLCTPIIINPEAVLFHTIFRFTEISLNDSVLYWFTKGERGLGEFEVERLYNGIWVDQEVQQATGVYEGQAYAYYPNLEEGSNKYRIKYLFPQGSRIDHLYSQEMEFEFYPERVEFKPKSAKTRLYLSRSTHYEIYDKGNTLVLEGQGSEIDVTVLRRGNYVIYFNGRDPGSFIKE